MERIIRTRRGSPGRVLPVVMVLALLAACGGGSGGGGGGSNPDPSSDTEVADVGTPAETDPDGADLSAAALASGSSRPLHRIELSGLPDGLDGSAVYARYRVLSGDIEGIDADAGERLLPVFRLDDVDYLLTPLLDADGSSIAVVVTDGVSTSEVFELSLDALPPPRTGAVTELADAMDDLLRAATETLGKTYPDEWEQWRDGSLNQMPEYLYPLMRAWHAFVDADNEKAWSAQDFDADTRRLLERILAERPIIETIEQRTAFIEGDQSTLAIAAQSPLTMSGTVMRPVRHGVEPDPVTANAGERWDLDGLITINDAGELAERLDQYNEARRAERNLELFDETVGTYLAGAALVLSAPSGGSGAAAVSAQRRAAMEAVSNIASGVGDIAGASRWFLPCCIARLDTELDPADGVIAQEDARVPQLALADATAVAESEGVDLTREIAERIIGKVASDLDDELNDLVSDAYNDVAAAAVDDYAETAITEAFLSDFPVGAAMTFIWEDIDMMAGEPQRWLEADPDTFSSAGEPIIEQRDTPPERMEFELVTPAAFERQESLLRFQTVFDELDTPVATDTREIELEYIELVFDPPRITIDDDTGADPIPFELQVRNSALHTGDEPFVEEPLTMEPEIGTINYVDFDGDAGILGFEYTPPADFPADTIIQVSTQSTTEQGIRDPANSPPARTGSMFITGEAQLVDIAPVSVCLDDGESQQFTALDPWTGDPVDAEWSVSSGSISADGLFTAPSAGSEATITAETETESATATAVLNDCACFWTARVSGGGYGNDARAGPIASMSLEIEDNAYAGIRFRGEGDENDTALTFELDPPLPVDASGATSTTATFNLGNPSIEPLPTLLSLEPMVFEDPPPDKPPLTVDITAREPLGDEHPDGSVQMKGSISGSVYADTTAVQQDPASAYLDLRFAGPFSYAPLNSETIRNCQIIY